MAFQNAQYVDARNSTFNSAQRDQINFFNNGGRSPWSNPRPYVPGPPSESDDDDPPSWTEGYEDPPSWSQGYRDPPSNTRGYSEPQPSQPIVQPPQWLGGISRPQQPHSQSSPSVLNRSMPMPIIYSILHTTPDVPLDRALTTFQTYISPSKKPAEWVAENICHVNSIVEDTTLTKSVEIRQARIPSSFILFPRLIVYIFAHLMHCTPDKSLFAEFKSTLQRWMTWDVIVMIQNHQQVKDALRDFFQRGLLSTPGSHSEITYNQLLADDVVGLSARLTVIINDDAEYKKLVCLEGPGAQSVANLLQAVCYHIACSSGCINPK
jgi:hypothetical protein